MQRKLIASLCATAAVAAGVTATSAASNDRHARHWGDRGLSAVALTAEQSLLTLRTDRPEWARSVGRVLGLTGGDSRIVGIDYRPATGDLYGVGNAGGVYVIDDRSARATLRSRLSVPLAGTAFGVDFNPVVDRLRIVSDTGQNLRDNVDGDNDTLTDGTLTFPGPPPATALGIAGAAYTNNDADPNTGTTLFDLDSALDQVAIQSPANAGLLVPTGKLGVDAGSDVGFDIGGGARRGTTERGVASIGSRLYAIDLLSGKATALGDFPRRHAVTGIAISTDQR